MRRFLIGVLTVACILAPGVAGATILTFDQMELNDSAPIPQEYGDNVDCGNDHECCDDWGCYNYGTGYTPHVTVEYRTMRAADGQVLFNQLSYWESDYGDLKRVAIAPANETMAEVALVAHDGYVVTLNSFKLAGWPQEDIANQIVRIVDGNGNVLIDFSPVMVKGESPGKHYTLIKPVVPLVSPSKLRIQFGPSWRVGIDDIDFDEARFESSAECTINAECQANLSVTANALVTCEQNLDACNEELDHLAGDSDQDGIPDIHDLCPGTPPDVEVDMGGCSLEQFCGQLDMSDRTNKKLCKRLDWQNDEPRMRSRERDCTIRKDRKSGNVRCEPSL